MAIRRVALVTCIIGLLGVVIPAWNYFATALRHPNWQFILLILFAPIMPLFYFALYRNRAALLFQKDLRMLALGAALALGILIGTGLPDWIALFQRTSVLSETRHSWKISDSTPLFALLSDLASLVMLAVLSRPGTEDANPDVPVSQMLRVMAKVATVAWGLWVLFQLFRVVSLPYTYSLLRNYAAQLHRPPPPFVLVVGRTAREALSQACLFVGPYVVWRSISRREHLSIPVVPENEEPGPNTESRISDQ